MSVFQVPNYQEEVINWIYSSDECMPRYSSVSLSVMSTDLGYASSMNGLMNRNSMLIREVTAIRSSVDSMPSVPISGTNAFLYKAIELGSWVADVSRSTLG